ncbi:DNA translocase FtsK, partial [Bacillus sp. HC-TM]
QVEERPVQQVAEPQVEERPVQQVVEPQVEEQPMQQVVVEQVQKPISSTEVQEKAYVVNQRENDMRNVLHTPLTYTVPPLALLSIPQQSALDNTEWLEEQKELLDTTFNNFHVGAHVINVSQGPAVTRFEVQPDPGVKVNKITNLSDDIKLSLAAKDIRIEAPIPGKSAIGSPEISSPSATVSGDSLFVNTGLLKISRRNTGLLSLFGTSIPIALFPGIGA